MTLFIAVAILFILSCVTVNVCVFFCGTSGRLFSSTYTWSLQNCYFLYMYCYLFAFVFVQLIGRFWAYERHRVYAYLNGLQSTWTCWTSLQSSGYRFDFTSEQVLCRVHIDYAISRYRSWNRRLCDNRGA